MSTQKPTVICLMGPTASGKTQCALEWVKQYPFDIISVDSALVYRGMDIGSAKPSPAILAEVPHRLIDIIEPNQAYSAADFSRDATREIRDIIAKGRTPLLVGGTMLYYTALQKGLSKLPESDPHIREQLNLEYAEHGLDYLYQQLIKVDLLASQRINANDKQRIQRALEVYRISGTPLSELQTGFSPEPEFNFINIGILPDDRAVLHQRIALRFQQMLDEGFIEEVEHLRARGDLSLESNSMRAVGYRQVWQYLDGILTRDQLLETGIAATRQLAKRQLTWLRHWEGLVRMEDFDLETVL